MNGEPGDITAVLNDARNGDDDAIAELYQKVGDKLKEMARIRLRSNRDPLMQTTMLSHDAFVGLLNARDLPIKDRQHFYALAARLMSKGIYGRIRERCRLKRNRGVAPVSLEAVEDVHDQAAGMANPHPNDLEQRVARILDQLARQCGETIRQVTVLRDIWGMTIADTAALLSLSASTVKRYNLYGRAFLARKLRQAGFELEEPNA